MQIVNINVVLLQLFGSPYDYACNFIIAQNKVYVTIIVLFFKFVKHLGGLAIMHRRI
jgi:hypothetical protein